VFDIPSAPTGFAICFGQGMDCIVRVVREHLIELLDIPGYWRDWNASDAMFGYSLGLEDA
jgi:hypothetical protein